MHLLVNHSIRPLPSSFGKRVRAIQSGSLATNKPKRCKMFEYDRDIICLPKNFIETDGSIPIPRSGKVRQMLASNGLIGKIHLDSTMSEEEIFQEIRAVFRKPMKQNHKFRFNVLQPAGGGSKTLMIPSLSESFTWTASAVAGKNAKMPIYILALQDFEVICL